MTLIHSRGKETEGHHFQIHWGTKSRTRRCVFCSLELFLIGHKLWALWRDTRGLGRLGGYRQMQCLLVSETQPSSQLSELWILNGEEKIVLQWITSSVQPRHHNNNSTSIKIVQLKCHSTITKWKIENREYVGFVVKTLYLFLFLSQIMMEGLNQRSSKFPSECVWP